ncbi:MAG TPA: sigma-70 family RNA polymerase sigma factor [Blastocatellia bacterium]|nr:sigma-70 family RNA polymerase sigma factor [Blastocatellia bacterium]
MERPARMKETDTESNIIAACQQGDRKAFQQLFETYKDRVYSMALHFSRDESLARDITQQVFLKLFTSISQFRRDSEFTTWLYRIVANACTDEQRKRSRFVALADGYEVKDMEAKDSQEESYARRQVADSVRAAIGDLTPKLRLAILLKYVEGLSYDEIAEALGCSKGTVASRLNRGHKILAQKLSYLRSEVMSGE